MDDSVHFQKQIRDNSADLHSFLADLNSWEDEMKRKGNETESLNKQQELPPVRSKLVRTNESKPKRTSHEYQFFDKLDIDTELANFHQNISAVANEPPGELEKKLDKDKLENEKKSEIGLMNFHEKMEQAYAEKEKGNKLVKTANWANAVHCYTNAIASFQSDPVFYANRALCYLKLNMYKNCEIDCTNALKLDPKYVKALHRRATARIHLNQNDEALEDLRQVIQIEPNNKESLKELAKLEKLLNITKPVQGGKTTQANVATNDLDDLLVAPNVFTEETEAVLNQWPQSKLVKEVDAEQIEKAVQNLGVRKDENVIEAILKAPNIRSKKPLKRIDVKDIEVNAEYLEYRRLNSDGGLQDILETNLITTTSNLVDGCKEDNLEVVGTPVYYVPKTYLQFEKQWKLCHNFLLKSEFLSMIPYVELPNIFKNFLESDMLTEILQALPHCDENVALDILKTMPKVKRFATLMLFVPETDRICVKDLINQLFQDEKLQQDDFESLKTLYGL